MRLLLLISFLFITKSTNWIEDISQKQNIVGETCTSYFANSILKHNYLCFDKYNLAKPNMTKHSLHKNTVEKIQNFIKLRLPEIHQMEKSLQISGKTLISSLPKIYYPFFRSLKQFFRKNKSDIIDIVKNIIEDLVVPLQKFIEENVGKKIELENNVTVYVTDYRNDCMIEYNKIRNSVCVISIGGLMDEMSFSSLHYFFM
jgi:flagellin-specific chaperone FliS